MNDNKRILSLDVFRGLTIVLMILVNSQGNQNPYPILQHVDWNGCSLADLVFPFFLFIVGLTTVVSFSKHQKNEIDYREILKRSLYLFLLGLFLNIFPTHFNIESLRVYGILQRIAVCYLICSYIYLNTNIKTQVLIFLVILLGYWFVMTQVPVPGLGISQLKADDSWVSYFDQLIFSKKHLFAATYDPEGFFSTLPSVATTLSGMLIGHLLLSSVNSTKKISLMMDAGIGFIIVGWLWSDTFPLNKNLWTSSFVLWTSGWAFIIFALCYFIIDVKHYEKWAFPFKVFGMNALFAFVIHVMLLKLQFAFIFNLSDGSKENIKLMITNALFSGYSASLAALMYALVFLILNYFFVLLLYKRKLFIRV